MTDTLQARLREAANEIAREGHYGWGNCCTAAADRLDALEADLALYKKRVADIATEREQLEAALDAAREALKMVEWVKGVCPRCRQYHLSGHRPDCEIQLALAGKEQP